MTAALRKEKAFFVQTGRASYYGAWHDGMATASGDSFDPDDFTAAHRTLAFGTVVRVTNLANGRMVRVRVIDRGPRIRNRVIDLSTAAARELGMWRRGLAKVKLRVYRSDQDTMP